MGSTGAGCNRSYAGSAICSRSYAGSAVSSPSYAGSAISDRSCARLVDMRPWYRRTLCLGQRAASHHAKIGRTGRPEALRLTEGRIPLSAPRENVLRS